MAKMIKFSDVGMETPKNGEEITGELLFMPPQDGSSCGEVAEVRRATYFVNSRGSGWVLDTDRGTIPVYI